MSFIFPTHTEASQTQGPISLVDSTKAQNDVEADQTPPAEEQDRNDSEEEIALNSSKTLSQKVATSRAAAKDERRRRKYKKFQEDRYIESPDQSRPEAAVGSSTSKATGSEDSTPTLERHFSFHGSVAAAAAQERLRRGQKKVKKLLKQRPPRKEEPKDTAIDTLYENQRGAFFCGLPLFSSASLLNFDPAAWLNGEGRPSPVNVTDAQLPDGSHEWQWAWPSWFVDMSTDVDEEGWQYSFMFQKKFPWHGTHPWFHSFVRRRRWIRKRIKRRDKVPATEASNAPNAHKFNKDYFTIHPDQKDIAQTDTSSTLQPTTSSLNRKPTRLIEDDDDEEDEEADLDNIATLLLRLKRSRVDRERITRILHFVDYGDETTHYLAEEMPQILSLFLYQDSRRMLLESMLQRMAQAQDRRDEHKRNKTVESDDERRKADDLMRAVEATEAEVQKLEFWSDVKGVVQGGHSFSGAQGANSADEKAVEPVPNSTKEDHLERSANEKSEDEASQPQTSLDKGKQKQGVGVSWDNMAGIDASGPAGMAPAMPKTDEKGRIKDEEVKSK
ncbi:MAG: hypothetical protein M1831_004042 [Alyxoria varia]|nr:MAG: hypothetical protein M1831_004042 [Alyxoria varia]